MTVFPVLLALALTIPLFGKGLIAVTMAIGLFLSFPVIWRDYRAILKCVSSARIDLALIGVIAACWFIAGITALNPEAALSHALRFSSIMFAGAILYAAMIRTGFDINRFYQSVTVFSGIAAGLIILNAISPVFPSDMVRTSYGSVLALLLPFIMREWMVKKSALSVICLSLIIMAISALGGRTGWVTLVAVIVLCGCLLPWRTASVRIASLVKLLVGVTFAAAMGIVLYIRLVGMDIFRARVTDLDMDRPASGRLDIWHEASGLISENPWFGVGIKGVREIDLAGNPLHVHNIILELLVDTGWCGLLAVALLLMWVLAGFIRSYSHCDDGCVRLNAIPVLIAFMAYGVASLALTSFFHAWWFLYGLILCILLRYMANVMRSKTKSAI